MEGKNRYSGWNRLIAILSTLETGPKTIRAIATKCGCAESTARRDLKWLAQNTSIVRVHTHSRPLFYCRTDLMSDGRMAFPAALWLSMAEQTLQSLQNSGTRDGAEPWLGKAREYFPKEDRKVLAFESGFQLTPEQHEAFDEIAQALYQNRLLQLEYRSPKGQLNRECVEPWSLLNWRERLYLVVLRRSASAQRPTLRRLDRIVNASAESQKFDYPSPEVYTPHKLFSASLGPFIQATETLERVVLRFYGFDAKYHRHYAWPVAHEILTDGDPLVVALDVQSDWGLKHFILRLGNGVEVVEPQDLRNEIGHLLKKAANRY